MVNIATGKNSLGKLIAQLEPDKRSIRLAELSELKKEESLVNEHIKRIQPEFDELIQLVPQPADKDVPLGKDDSGMMLEMLELSGGDKNRGFLKTLILFLFVFEY